MVISQYITYCLIGEALKRRTVGQIKTYLKPSDIYKLITKKIWDYAPSLQKEFYVARDQAMMSLSYEGAGRIKETLALNRDNLEVMEGYILVSGMNVFKRTEKIIKKYGESVTVRDDFPLPLERGLFENRYYDELVPFSKLVLAYLEEYNPKGKLFNIGRRRAWQIIYYVTSYYPNWFRAQSEHFYGNFIMKDTVKLAKFVKVVNPMQVAHYIGYDWTEQLKRR